LTLPQSGEAALPMCCTLEEPLRSYGTLELSSTAPE
jgi:hypothetical protein